MTSSAARFSKRLWQAGLSTIVLLGAAGAQAQTTAPAEPPCALMVKGIDGYVFVRMRNFDPSNKAVPLFPADPADNINAVVCERKTLIPELTDYRILSEMQLPLAIKSGGVTVWLGADNGRLTLQVPAGQVSDTDQQAIKARVGELQASVDAQKAAAEAAAQAQAAKAAPPTPTRASGGQAPPQPSGPTPAHPGESRNPS